MAVHISICPQTVVFVVQPLRSPGPSHLHFYSRGHSASIVHSDPFKNEETLHQHNSEVCQTIRIRLGNFEKVRQSMIGHVYSYIDPRGGYFEPLLWIVTWQTIRIQYLLFGNVYCKCIMAVACKCYSFKFTIVESNLSTKHKNRSFPDIRSYEFFLCFDVNPFLKFVHSPCIYCLGRLTRNDAIQARTTLFNASLKVLWLQILKWGSLIGSLNSCVKILHGAR